MSLKSAPMSQAEGARPMTSAVSRPDREKCFLQSRASATSPDSDTSIGHSAGVGRAESYSTVRMCIGIKKGFDNELDCEVQLRSCSLDKL